MKFRFENLQVWQDARAFANHIYSITKHFPNDERFGLIDQLRRAVVSISLNIAEGSDRKSDIEFKRYLRMAITSTEEVVTALFIALDQKYLSQSAFDKLYEEAHMIVAKLNALINKLTDYRLQSTVKSRSRKSVDGRHQWGFTLIELMVAVSIIAVLSAIGLTTFKDVQSKARDSVRKSDLNKLATALELYFQRNNGHYPSTNGAWWGACSGYGSHSDTGADGYIPNLAPTYMQVLPHDPREGVDNTNLYASCTVSRTCYLYRADANGTDYKLLAHCTIETPVSENDPYYDPTRAWAYQVSSSNTSVNW